MDGAILSEASVDREGASYEPWAGVGSSDVECFGRLLEGEGMRYLVMVSFLVLAGCCLSATPGPCPQPVVDLVHLECEDPPLDEDYLPFIPDVYMYEIPKPLFPEIRCLGNYCWDEQGNEYRFDELDLDPRT